MLYKPYVLASQVQEVFYVEDSLEKDWHAVIKHASHGLYNMLKGDSKAEYYVICYQNESYNIREDEDVI